MKSHFESGPEHIPTSEEVMGIIARFAEKATLVRELSDEQGLYLLEAKIEDDTPGEVTQYEYMRKGQFPNNNSSAETVIHIVYYQDGVPCGGHDVASFNSETGMWVDGR